MALGLSASQHALASVTLHTAKRTQGYYYLSGKVYVFLAQKYNSLVKYVFLAPKYLRRRQHFFTQGFVTILQTM